MRKYIYLLCIFALFCSCEKSDNVFKVNISQENIRQIRPVPGGAVMYYTLPSDLDVMAIRVRYKDDFKQEIMREGSYACDSLLLHGFNEGRQGVEAVVTLCDRNGIESEPLKITFDTQDSGPFAFFNELKVKSGWNGFSISYNVPAGGKGMAHVFYVGENPLTQEPDTLLVKSFSFKAGKDSLNLKTQQEASAHTVIVRTEDFRGYTVKQQIWQDVKSYNTMKLDTALFVYSDPEGLCIEDKTNAISKNYLFDGDLKGFTSMGGTSNYMGTYIAGPSCFGKTLFELDLKEAKQLAGVRFYTILNLSRPFFGIFANAYENRVPCDITIYASNDRIDWDEVGHYDEPSDLDFDLRWAARCKNSKYLDMAYSTELEVQRADPCYLSIDFPIMEKHYQYVKVVVNKTFFAANDNDYNTAQHVTFHEFELYVGKE